MNTIERVHGTARFFDAISNGIQRMKVNETSAKSSETEIRTPEIKSRNGTAINLDLISQTV